jgi:formate hydrogenlyase subunit 3/multisubunit Na+/H+ antiporter MnhD subunit
MKKVYKIILTVLSVYCIFSSVMMLIWMLIGGRILWLTPMGILGEANQLNWYIPLLNIIPLVILIIFIWKKNEEKNNKKNV